MKNLLKVMASGLLLFAFSACSSDGTDYAFTTKPSERVGLALPDETKVRVNAGTGLDYNAKKFDRELFLKGEAFFQVANQNSSFTIETANGIVFVPRSAEVNVRCRGNVLEASVFGGSAEIRTKGNKLIKSLTMGHAARVIGKKLDAEWLVDAPGAPGWMRGKSEFTNIPFSYVILEMEAQFGISIDPNNVDVNQLYTGSFINADLSTALNMVFSNQGIQYELIENSKFRLIQ